MSSPPTLSQRINASTRPQHTRLNALILSLLPLALPPHASNPDLYTLGIAHILPIYEAFEKEFASLLSQPNPDKSNENPTLTEPPNPPSTQRQRKARITDALQTLHIPSLQRTTRLRTDIATLRHPPHTPSTIPIRPTPRLSALTTHIHSTLPHAPHLALAYTWTLYMALFSGGRHIRSALQHASPGFWTPPLPPRSLSTQAPEKDDAPLSFWSFDGDADGEDLKAEFKARFQDVEACLSEGEKEEVVSEGVRIMEGVRGVVEEIVGVVENRREQVRWMDGGKREEEGPRMRWLLAKHILPMGMVELMTGAARYVMQGSRGSSCEAAGDGKM